ncbi:hypothetical protein EVAR_17598_1 [Eumeta japonica]|uniref:Uncharacterized protein n=1 Tax=Eumeta variegata TaxID=151549 RepID=A0A4C1UC83_EUMVA|nr:hypothetical protein EVAR_17598_1 [Eumeta japonica]
MPTIILYCSASPRRDSAMRLRHLRRGAGAARARAGESGDLSRLRVTRIYVGGHRLPCALAAPEESPVCFWPHIGRNAHRMEEVLMDAMEWRVGHLELSLTGRNATAEAVSRLYSVRGDISSVEPTHFHASGPFPTFTRAEPTLNIRAAVCSGDYSAPPLYAPPPNSEHKSGRQRTVCSTEHCRWNENAQRRSVPGVAFRIALAFGLCRFIKSTVRLVQSLKTSRHNGGWQRGIRSVTMALLALL